MFKQKTMVMWATLGQRKSPDKHCPLTPLKEKFCDDMRSTSKLFDYQNSKRNTLENWWSPQIFLQKWFSLESCCNGQMYGENMMWSECLCSPPNLVVEIQIPNVMILRGRHLGADGISLMNGINALRKERCTELPCPFTMWDTTSLWPRRWPSPDDVDTPISDFQPWELQEIDLCCL